MERYKADLQKFRQCMTLKLFCQADTSTEYDPPPDFRKVVVEHDWPDTVTLEDVEKFRRRYARTYNLQTCAMMLHTVRPGLFIVTWFVPVTVIDILRKKTAVEVYKEFKVSRLEIYVQATAVCVYQTPVHQQVPSLPPSTSSSSPPMKRYGAEKSELTWTDETIGRELTREMHQMRVMRLQRTELHQQLAIADETIKRERQQMQMMKQLETRLQKQLARKESELTKAEETIRREQQQMEQTEEQQRLARVTRRESHKMQEIRRQETELQQQRTIADEAIRRERQEMQQQETGLKKQLVRKEAELTKAEEGHRQQMEEMKQREDELQQQVTELQQCQRLESSKEQLKQKLAEMKRQESEMKRQKDELQQQLTRANQTISRQPERARAQCSVM